MEAMASDEDHRQKSGQEEFEHMVQSQISAKEQEIREPREEISAKKQEIRELTEEISAKEQEIRELTEEISAKEQELRGLEVELATASRAEVRSALEAKVQFLQQQIIIRNQQTMNLQQQITSLQQQITSLRQEITSLREEIKSLRSVQAGREKGLTSEPVSTVDEDIHRKLDFMSSLMQESLLHTLSRTRAASTINVDDLRVLRNCLDTAPLPEEEDVPLRSLLGAETEGGESFWDEDTYELQLKDEYIQQFKTMTACRDVVWNDDGMKIKKRFSNLEFPVVAKNDLVASLKRFRSLMSVGAILGVEIKRKLSWRGLRQAEVEFYVWASESQFPFIQLITDMERGGVAIYSKGGNDVRFRTLGSMEAVRNFVSGIFKSLPPGAGEDDNEDGIINPDTFPSPSRKRLRLSSLGMSSANPQGGSSSIGRQMAFWSMAAAYNNNLGDVANLRDLDCFNVDPVQ